MMTKGMLFREETVGHQKYSSSYENENPSITYNQPSRIKRSYKVLFWKKKYSAFVIKWH